MTENEKAMAAAIAALSDVTAAVFAAHTTMIHFIGERTLNPSDAKELTKHAKTLEGSLVGYQRNVEKLKAALK